MPYMKSFALGKALLYGVLLWVAGFVWGGIVFMTGLRAAIPAIPYVSRSPAISLPILLIWLVVSWLLARNFLKTVERRAEAGLRLGLVFVLVNMLLDLVVLVLLMKHGFRLYESLAIWVAYLILFAVPTLVGRARP